MELARHGLSARLIVHPQLRVRRIVDGAMSAVAGLVNGPEPTHDELAESWMHIEIARLGDGEGKVLADDLQRVLHDVRVSVEDSSRMRARALNLAAGPARRAGRAAGRRPGRRRGDGGAAGLAGRGALHVPGLPGVRPGAGTGRRWRCAAVPGTGLGLLRHDKAGPGSSARCRPRRPRSRGTRSG